ncbi:MAG: GAF and ANTAR domain-containing protein [Nocardioidaceae bacterium]
MDDRNDIDHALTMAARGINRRANLEETLSSIVEVAQNSLSGFDQVGISLVDRKGNVQTKAATGELVWTLDKLQYELGEGPCVETLHDKVIVEAPDLRHDQRWPRYVPRAVAEGLKAQLAVKLYLDEQGTLGGLNIYSTTREDIDPQAVHMAELFAAHAAIALGYARERQNLNEALHSRKVIGQAIGIVMERYDLTEERAFAFLVRASSHSNVKLRDIAQAMVDEANKK